MGTAETKKIKWEYWQDTGVWEKHTGEQQYASQLLSVKWKTFLFLESSLF